MKKRNLRNGRLMEQEVESVVAMSVQKMPAMSGVQIRSALEAENDTHIVTDIAWGEIEKVKDKADVADLTAEQSTRASADSALQAQIDAITAILSADDTGLDTAQERIDAIKQLLSDVDTLAISDVPGLQSALDARSTDAHIRGDAASGETLGTLRDDINNFSGFPSFANDAAAGIGGLTAGDVYISLTGIVSVKL